jgi:hypothetical protein
MNENQIYLDSDLRAIESTGRLDANEGIFFARQLEYVRAQAYDVRRAPLSALRMMPVSNEVDEGAEYITYEQYDQAGIAKIIANYADDLPRADVSGKQFVTPIRSIGDSYGYSMQEIRAARMANKNLEVRKQAAARRAHDELINRLAWAGDPISGLPGFLNNPNIPTYVIPATGTGTSKLWSTKTPDQILADMNGMVNQVYFQSKGIHRANQLWLPLEQHSLIQTMPRSSMSDTTVLDFFLRNNPGVTVMPLLELDGANGGLDAAIALENDRDNYVLELPMLFRQHAPQQRNLEFVVPCESRFAGVTVFYPLAFAKADSI